MKDTNMKKAIILILLSILCHNNEAFSQRPSWVELRPVDSSYYIGIVQVNKNSSDYMKIARQEALQEISNEISTIIISNIDHSISEIGESIRELFSSNVIAYSSNQLEGYELFQKWEDSTECWVYYRLSKSTFEALREEKLKGIKMGCIENLNKASQNADNGNIEQALYFAFSALKSIEDYYFDNLRYLIDGNQAYLSIEAIQMVNELFSKIEIEGLAEPIIYKHTFPINRSLCFKILYKNAQQQLNLTNLPFHISFSKGDGQILADKKSQSDSICASIVQIFSVQPYQTIEAKLNTAYYDSAFSFNDDMKKIIGCLNVPSSEVSIQVLSPVFSVISSEINFADTLMQPAISPGIIEQLVAKHFTTSYQSDSEIDLEIVVNGRTIKGSEFNGITTAIAEGDIEITNIKTDTQIFYKSYSRVSGGHLIEKDAGLNALQNLRDLMLEDLNSFLEINN
ncbi:MAG: LPP20 family lipoprotein [Bacteroidales bacterium]|nr:LPP20 family lipoprotein [Bacteroidales bacterium]